MKSHTNYFLVSVADTLEEINKHWDKLEAELVPTATQIEDHETLIQFFCAKSASVSTSARLLLRVSRSPILIGVSFRSWRLGYIGRR